MLEVIGLSCSRNDNVLFSNLNFNLAPGEALHISAANGVGKTSLLKIIANLLPASSGRISGCDSLLYLGHKNNLHPALSALANLKYLCAINAVNPLPTSQQLLAALQFADLNFQADIACEELSAGQCQRINLARLFLSQAKLWLLDEPFTNLDVASKTLYQTLCAAHLAAGGMLVIATHADFALPNKIFNTLHLSAYA